MKKSLIRMNNSQGLRFHVCRGQNLWVTAAIVLCFVDIRLSAQDADADQEPQSQQSDERFAAMEARIGRLESRLEKIENALFASIRYSETEARKELKRAKIALEYSERLHAKGLLSAIQLRFDRANLRRAQELLELCLQHEDHRVIGANLEVFDAIQNVETRRMQLTRSEAMYQRGFVAKTQIERDRDAIELAEKKLESARAKLKALRSNSVAPKSDQPKDDQPKEKTKK